MVRASRNVSNARRGDRVLGAESMPRGYEGTHAYRAALAGQDRTERAAARMAEAQRAQAPPGAALDHFPWSRSWGAFLAAVRDKDDGQGARAAIAKARASQPRNAWTEAIPSGGGYLVPWKLTQQVFAYMQTGIIRPRCTVVPMDAPKVAVPIVDSPSEAGGVGPLGGMAWNFTPDGQPITATTPQFGRKVLEAWADKALLQNVPNDLIADATSFTESFLPQIIARGLSWHTDDVVLYQGSGVGQPEALVNAGAALTVTRTTSDAVVHTDVVTILKSLHPASKTTATWLASDDTFDQLLDLYFNPSGGSAAGIVAPSDVLTFDNGRFEMFGLELVPNGHQPATGTPGDLMLCDLEWLLLGERQEMTVEISSKGAGFASDASNIRIRYRWDSRFALPQPITLGNEKVTSALVVLQ